MMSRFFLALLALIIGTPAAVAEAPKFATRQLSDAEKVTLSRALAVTFKDPAAAQFKWMPVVVVRADKPLDTPIGYCGLVNGKNSFGGYIGFKRFYATLKRNDRGEFDRGAIEHIEGAPITFGGDSTVDDALETGMVEGSCRAWGYIDFTAAR